MATEAQERNTRAVLDVEKGHQRLVAGYRIRRTCAQGRTVRQRDSENIGETSDSLQPELHVGAPRSAAKAKPTGSLLTFFSLTYALMWACFISVAAAIPATTLLGRSLLLLGTFAPSLAALWLTARSEGGTGVNALLRRVIQWRVALPWYLFAAGYMAVIKLTVAVVHRVSTGAWPHFGHLPWYVIPGAVLFSTPFQAGEEIGWRGYALPRLAARLGLAGASILLGFIWGFWHLPQFFIPGADTYGQSFLVFLLQVTALSVAIAWLYARTNRSLLLPMLMHAAVNNSKDIVPSAVPGATNPFGLSTSPVAWLTVTVLWICAAYFLVQMPKTEWTAQQWNS